jgi:hypothetical protein
MVAQPLPDDLFVIPIDGQWILRPKSNVLTHSWYKSAPSTLIIYFHVHGLLFLHAVLQTYAPYIDSDPIH